MITLNLFTEDGTYVCSIQKETHEECGARANEAYPELFWAWDHDHRIKHKRFNPCTDVPEQKISLQELFG